MDFLTVSEAKALLEAKAISPAEFNQFLAYKAGVLRNLIANAKEVTDQNVLENMQAPQQVEPTIKMM